MPFDIGESINYLADSFLRAPIVHSVSKNPVYTALVITFLIMIIIMFVFRDVDSDDPLLTLILRAGFWAFLGLTSVIFLHDKVLLQEQFSAEKNAVYDDVFNGSLTPARAEDDVVPVRAAGV